MQNETSAQVQTSLGGDSDPKLGPIKKSEPGLMDAGTREKELVSTEETELGRLRQAEIAMAWVLSDRSLSLKLRLKSGKKAVFKPLLKHDNRGLKEVAAFLVARCLKIPRVPVSTLKGVSLSRMMRLVELSNPEVADALGRRAAVDARGVVHGAIIKWIEGLDPEGIKKLGGNGSIFGLLGRKERLKNPALAHSAAEMVIFDYLVGNWDRFTGANFFPDPRGRGFVWLDHNNAFARLSERQSGRLQRVLDKMEWFPAGLVQRIERLEVEDISSALAREPGHGAYPLLSESEIKRLFERREKLLFRIDSLVQQYGKENVLVDM